jgi:hypothetical protein
MPITAKLSQTFDDRLGHDVADEMVGWFNAVDGAYRNELREINDLNFARFDARMEQRFAEAEVKMERRFAEYDVKMEQRFAAAEVKVERRFAEYDVKMEQRFAEAEVKMVRRFAEYDVKLERGLAEVRVEMREHQLTLLRWMIGMWIVQLIATAGLWMRR